MRPNTIIMLGLALIFGAAAVFLSKNWLERQARRPTEPTVAATVQPQNVSTETIVVAGSALKFGMEVRPDQLKEIHWPEGAVPEGAYRRVADIFAREGRRVALGQVEVNEPLLMSKISNPGQKATLSAVISEGMNAVTVRVDDVNGVAGFVTPGDRVDVLLTRNQDEGPAITEVMVELARVLAVDQTVEQRGDTPSVPKAVTLEVESASAQKVAFASVSGKISLVLRRAGDGAGLDERERRVREATVSVQRGGKRHEYAVRSEAVR